MASAVAIVVALALSQSPAKVGPVAKLILMMSMPKLGLLMMKSSAARTFEKNLNSPEGRVLSRTLKATICASGAIPGELTVPVEVMIPAVMTP